MEAWIGPAIVAAVIAALVNVAGWYVTYHRERRLEAARRTEKVRDYMTALKAEIRAHNFRWTEQDAADLREGLKRRLSDDSAFVPFLTREAEGVVFPAIIGELHILPGDVIDPVVRYQRQVVTIGQAIEDIRSPAYSALDPQRKLELFGNYIELRMAAAHLAGDAINALDNTRSVS